MSFTSIWIWRISFSLVRRFVLEVLHGLIHRGMDSLMVGVASCSRHGNSRMDGRIQSRTLASGRGTHLAAPLALHIAKGQAELFV